MHLPCVISVVCKVYWWVLFCKIKCLTLLINVTVMSDTLLQYNMRDTVLAVCMTQILCSKSRWIANISHVLDWITKATWGFWEVLHLYCYFVQAHLSLIPTVTTALLPRKLLPFWNFHLVIIATGVELT